ncbi:MAG: hybrid sensor histidine kinase/response regulator, partial [Myxococcales bacterium]
YAVATAPDGLTALATIRATPPDLVLSDVMMPGLDGFALLKELRSGPDTRALPVILLSARAGEESRVEGIEAGADDYLVKPFSGRELLARVRSTLELARMRREVTAASEQAAGAARQLEAERQARAEVERASQLKDEFLATLSHELRTPLSAILGWSQMLVNGHTHDPQLTRGLQTIERNARAQKRIVEDLLDMSRILGGKLGIEARSVDLGAVVHAAVDTTRPAAVARGIELAVTLDPLAGPVHADPDRLQQVLWNLLSNAVKFTPRGGQVTVTLGRAGDDLEVRVADTGQGIEPAFLAHVFDRFRQADGSMTRAHGGLGLGLAIARQLVELHGGRIEAHSEGPGRGSLFVVTLPGPAAPPGA